MRGDLLTLATMRKADALIYGVMAVGFGAIAWTAWSERAPMASVPKPLVAAGVEGVRLPTPFVQGRSGDPRRMYEYKIVRIPRLINDDDDEVRHAIMMKIAYRLCYDFPFYGFEEQWGYGEFTFAQNRLNERDASELGPEGLRIYQDTFAALCAWDTKMWDLVVAKYGFGAHGPDRPASMARAESVEALSFMLERVGDAALEAAIKQPKEVRFIAVKTKIATIMPEKPLSIENAIDPRYLGDFAALKDRLSVLTNELGRAAASLPPDEQVKLEELLMRKLKVFDDR